MARPASIDLLDELTWRGLIYQCTDEDALRAHLQAGTRRIYCGFDPTADSLTIGNLVPIMVLRHVQRAGHEPVVVMGGGTGMIGDPSGKSAERKLMTRETIDRHIRAQRPIFDAVLGDGIRVLNNADWLGGLTYLDALRSVGKHFSVNMMIQKESVRSRLESREQGISYTEFSYMVLQAYDFAYLHHTLGVTVQCGGSDQFGNMVAGTDLIRRVKFAEFVHGRTGGGIAPEALDRPLKGDDQPAVERLSARAFAFTAPLVEKADGGKFGKTESGAVWLTRERTSPYAYYQFWLNTADADVVRFLKTFTLLDRERIAELEALAASNPSAREAQRALAREATALLYGAAETDAVERAGRALFSGDVRELDEAMLMQVLAEAPASELSRDELAGGVDLIDLLTAVGLAKSRGEAKQFIASGSVLVNGTKAEPGAMIGVADVLHGRITAIRRGKKLWHVVRWLG
ncbi:MAG: tyrosine--tRNA ligase [Phycisphaerales bacterium]